MTDEPSNYQVESLGILDLLRMVVGPNTFLRRSLDTPMISWKYDCMPPQCLDRMEITGYPHRQRGLDEVMNVEFTQEWFVDGTFGGLETLPQTLGCQELGELQTYETSWWFHICFIFTLTWGNDPSWLIHIFHLGWISPNIWNNWSSLTHLNTGV